jgi:hypothetical protein
VELKKIKNHFKVMKKFIMMLTASGIFAVQAMSQECDTLRNPFVSTALTPDKNYVLEGAVVIPDGEILTIHPGVTICAMEDAALIVATGGRIEANGNADSLITFTSIKAPGLRTPGDWRGIVILGKANNNYVNGGNDVLPIQRNGTRYGGNDPAIDSDNSGTLAYVSIEYAGQDYMDDNYKGALLLNSVGDATTIHHVQIIDPLNAGMHILGGKVDAHDIYIQNAPKDDVYIEYGYSGTLTEVLAIKNPSMQAIAADARGIYVSNHGFSPFNTPYTQPIIDAFTLIGPQQCDEDDNDLSTGIYFNNNARGLFKNGVVSGFNIAISILDIYSAENTFTGNNLGFEYVALGNNNSIIEEYSPWPLAACSSSGFDWLDQNACDNNMVTLTLELLDYDESICGNCSSTNPKIFKLGTLTTIPDRENDDLKVGVLQEEPVFTWVHTCPQATCCQASPQARILPIEAYPNPVQHTIKLQLPKQADATVKVQIIDMDTGRKVYQGVAATQHALEVDMAGYPMGNYTIQVYTSTAIYQATVHKGE